MKLMICLAIVGLALGVLMAQESRPAADSRWDKIAPFFTPPDKYKDKLGQFRDVLKFDDGTAVKTPQDWAKRREEIRKFWQQAMGPWPEVLAKPAVKIVSSEAVENFTRHKIQLEVAAGVMQEAYLLVPQGKGPFPAVLVTWYNHTESAGIPNKAGDKLPPWAFGYDLAKRGFVTLCMGGVSGGGNVRQADGKGGIQPLSYAAYCAANGCNALANMPEVDPKRIGVTGHSFGGKWAMFASCMYDKFACAAWSDPGIVWNEADPNANFWEPWYLGYEQGKTRAPGVVTAANGRTGAYKALFESGHDVHELHALMAPRPVLVSGGEQDPQENWVALNHTIRVNKLLGYKDRVAKTQRDGHNPTPESNEQMYAFFEYFLKPK
jgi:dienelactone hydrolase